MWQRKHQAFSTGELKSGTNDTYLFISTKTLDSSPKQAADPLIARLRCVESSGGTPAQPARGAERLQSPPPLPAEFPWLTSADCSARLVSARLGSAPPPLRTQRRVKMLLSAPARAGITPYNGYAGKNAKKVRTPPSLFPPPRRSPPPPLRNSRRGLFELGFQTAARLFKLQCP